MHTRDGAAYRLTQQLYPLIKAAACFALEFDLNERNYTPNAQQFLLPEGRRLSDYLTPKQFQKLERILAKATGIDLKRVQHFQPFLVQSLVSEALLRRDERTSLDEHLFRYAREHDIPTVGIESYASQLAVLEQMPVEQQLKSLLAIGRHLRRYRRNLIDLRERYVRQDIHGLYRKTRRATGADRRLLLYDRNRRMADRITELARAQSVFAAIGAAHLAGRFGVLTYLKHANFTLTPLIRPESGSNPD